MIKNSVILTRLNQHILLKGSSLYKISEQLELGYTSFNRCFKGDSDIRNMRLGTLLDVCDLLGVPVGDILSEEKEVTDKRDEYIKRLEAENEGYKKSLKTLKDVVIAMNKGEEVKIKSPV